MRIAVTGAYGYSGRYIAEQLLREGHEVITLTDSPARSNPFGDRIRAFPFDFDRPASLIASLKGTRTLVNTYWVRFDHAHFSHERAVANTRILFKAARDAGVSRIIHVSITNPDPASNLPYFRGKAELEEVLRTVAVSHCIVRPAVLFGREDVLINNIAWALRRFPIFGLFGSGGYRLQPIYVGDLAALIAEQVTGDTEGIIHAIGPETFTYRALVETIARSLDLRRLIIGFPPAVGYIACRLVGLLVKDVVVTREEIRGLMEERLYVDAPPAGSTRLSKWVYKHRDSLGRRYTSELARRRDRLSAYGSN